MRKLPILPVAMTLDPITWECAQEHVNSLPRIPPVFTLAVRALMADHYKGGQTLSPASAFLVNRLMRSPTMKAILYYSALTFHVDEIDNCPYLSSADLIRLYQPGDLAAIIGVSCLYRTLVRQLTPNSSAQGLAALCNRAAKYNDIGGYIGYAIPAIGAGRAILAAASVPLAHALLYKLNEEKAELYAQTLYMDNSPVDTDIEVKNFGCTSYELASCLLMKVGFGLPWMNGLMTSLTSPALASSAQGEATHFSYALYWLDVLWRTGTGPTEKVAAVYYPGQKELYRLLFKTAQTLEMGSKYTWADKGKNDISPQLTPQLYQEYLVEAADPTELKDFCDKHISSELLEGISEEDYQSLSNKPIETEEL